MQKGFLILLLQLLLLGHIQAQGDVKRELNEMHRFLQHMADSLQRQLTTLQDTARIDCLHKIGIRYVWIANKDSALCSADRIEKESKKIRYIHCLALASRLYSEVPVWLDGDLDKESIRIPPMLLQPFVENAIWHGLMHKQRTGELNLELKLQDDLLCCTITDNGIGRSEAAILKNKSPAHNKSLGIQTTAKRVQLLAKDKKTGFPFEVTDLKNNDGSSADTKVRLIIPVHVFQNPIPHASI